MASAKKGKKNRGKTLALSDFLQETPGAVATMPIRKSSTNWADEVEDNHDVYDSRSAKTNVVLPTAPKASRDFDDIINKVPQDPPYIAYLTNLPYDVDENEITYFFKNMKIAHMRIPKDERPGEPPRLRGFGYVEFEDRESLLNALVIPDTMMKNRRIRIEVATDFDNDKRRTGRMDMNRDRGNRSDMSSFGDWRSGPRTESSNSSDMDRRGFSRDRDRDRDGGADSSSSGAWRDGERRQPSRDMDRGGFNRDRPSGGGFSRDRPSDGGGFSRDRPSDGGGFSRDRPSDGGGFSRDRPSDGGGFSRDRPSDGGGFSRDRPSDFRREERGGEDFGRSRGGDDKFMRRNYDGDRDRGNRNGGGGGFTRSASPPRDEDSNRNEPRQRPKLFLTPRTKPVEVEGDKPSASASIFGNAKPVDTAARERQIEERLAKDGDVVAAAPRRDGSKDRKEKEVEKEPIKEKKESVKPVLEEKKSVEKERKSDLNGVIDKDKSHHPKRNGDYEKKEVVKTDSGDKHKSEVRKRDDKKEKTEKEMPKLKKAEPPNFVASNKFAFLENEDSSD